MSLDVTYGPPQETFQQIPQMITNGIYEQSCWYFVSDVCLSSVKVAGNRDSSYQTTFQ